MPDAKPAVPAQPSSKPARAHTWLARLLGVVIALGVFVPVSLATPEPVAAGSCTGWTSTIVPPNYIRVLKRDGTVAKIKFKKYVVKVMASGEWPSRLPMALLRAGAQASKQFAWYHSLKGNHRRSYVNARGQCYDVTPWTKDQLFRAGADVTDKQRQARNAIWDLSLFRNNKFILTPYRAGTVKRCAADVDGKRLYAKSAKRCAWNGWSGKRILRTYYSGDNAVALVSGPVGSAVAFGPASYWGDDPSVGLEATEPFDLRVGLDSKGYHTQVVGQAW